MASVFSFIFQSDTFVSLLQNRQKQQSATSRAQLVQGLKDSSVTLPTAASHGLVGPTPKELDSFNELIQFDHVYYKPVPQSKLSPQTQNTKVRAHGIRKDNPDSAGNIMITEHDKKITENGCKNVKIIITSDAANLKNVKLGTSNNSLANEKVLTIPNMILDVNALQKLSDLENFHNESAIESDLVVPQGTVDTNTSMDTASQANSDDLMDLNFDLLEDLENIINSDLEGIASTEVDSLLSSEQDNVIMDSVVDNYKTVDCNDQIKGTRQKSQETNVNSVIDLPACVPSPSKSSSSFTDPDYTSETPSPYSSHDIASPLGESETSPLGENLWEESFTELFPDLL